jgi:hypothetical protein
VKILKVLARYSISTVGRTAVVQPSFFEKCTEWVGSYSGQILIEALGIAAPDSKAVCDDKISLRIIE